MSEKIYLTDTYLLKYSATVLSLSELDAECNNAPYKLVLNRTIFHPQGGGQPSDVGKILVAGCRLDVLYVRSTPNGIIEHFGKFSVIDDNLSADDFDSLKSACVNAVAELEVDRETRMNSAKSHSGGHLIDAALFRYGKKELSNHQLPWIPKKGYHFSDGANVEFEGKLESSDPLNRDLPVESDFICALNAHLNDLVNESIATDVVTVKRENVCAYCENIDVKGYPDEIRLVQIGNIYIPCGGTHVANTSELAGICVSKIKRRKGIVKISYSVPPTVSIEQM